MTRHLDETLVSAYMDGELDPAAMRDVEAAVGSSDASRDFMIASIMSQARMRSSLNGVLDQAIPDRLTAVLDNRSGDTGRNRSWRGGIARVAAAVVLLFTGGVAGMFLMPHHTPPMFSPSQLTPYQAVVNEALEYNRSGSRKVSQYHDESVTVAVTPVQTYRHRDGRYYREFRLEVTRKGKPVRINGLAYRSGKGRWNTKAILF